MQAEESNISNKQSFYSNQTVKLENKPGSSQNTASPSHSRTGSVPTSDGDDSDDITFVDAPPASSKHQRPIYVCSVCHSIFSSQALLELHITSAHAPKPFKCKICHKSFGSKAHLSRHTRNLHPMKTTRRNSLARPNGTTHTAEKLGNFNLIVNACLHFLFMYYCRTKRFKTTIQVS